MAMRPSPYFSAASVSARSCAFENTPLLDTTRATKCSPSLVIIIPRPFSAFFSASSIFNCPLTDETRNLFNAEMFSYFKPGAILLNTARGAIVDENALYDALTTGKLRACGSDVFVDESTSFTSPLNKLDNFIGFPHVAANTQESMYNMAMWAVEGLIDVIEGREPKYLYKY